MNQSQREYADYLTRLARNSTKTEQEFNQENIVREVGKSYGLSEKEMDEVGKYEIN
jgi:hypothetical protein